MKKPTPRELVYISCAVLVAIMVFRSWDAIVSFLGIVFTTIIPLVLGACIAYIVAIPTNFLERHMFPNSTSKPVVTLRKPLCLFITVFLVLAALVFAATTLIPALKETILMLQANIRPALIAISNLSFMEPLKSVTQFFGCGWEVLPGQIVPCDYCENRNDCVSAYFESLYDKEQQPECPFK